MRLTDQLVIMQISGVAMYWRFTGDAFSRSVGDMHISGDGRYWEAHRGCV